MEKRIIVNTALLHAEGCTPVQVEVETTKGIGIHVVGMPNEETHAMILRVMTALSEKGISLPGEKIVIYFSSVDSHKKNARWSLFDLPVFLALAAIAGKATVDKNALYLGCIDSDGYLRSGYGMSRDLSAYAEREGKCLIVPLGFHCTTTRINNAEILLDL